jgi:hypothetical protein
MKFMIVLLLVLPTYVYSNPSNIEEVSKKLLNSIIVGDDKELQKIYNNEGFDGTIFLGQTISGDANSRTIQSILNGEDIQINVSENPNQPKNSFIVTYFPKKIASSFDELVKKEKLGQIEMSKDYVVCQIDFIKNQFQMPHHCFFDVDFHSF